jgi:hypothetical protein
LAASSAAGASTCTPTSCRRFRARRPSASDTSGSCQGGPARHSAKVERSKQKWNTVSKSAGRFMNVCVCVGGIYSIIRRSTVDSAPPKHRDRTKSFTTA